MEELDNQIFEDGELISDSDNEILDKLEKCETFGDQMTSLTEVFDRNITKKNKLYTNVNDNNLNNNKTKDDKVIDLIQECLGFNEEQINLMEKEDEAIFKRCASPLLFTENAFLSKRIMPSSVRYLENRNNKYQSRKYRKTVELQKTRNDKFDRDNQNKNIIGAQAKEYSDNCLPSRKITQQLKICKFYLQDKCGKTEKFCAFLHSQFPCKYYYLGMICPDGRNCKLKHGGLLSEEMKEALLMHIQIAPREILGDFKISTEHAKKLLNEKQARISLETLNQDNVTSIYSNGRCNCTKYNPICLNVKNLSFEEKNIKKMSTASSPDNMKIENFVDILNDNQIESLKKVGIECACQLLTLSMIKLNACGINVMEIVKIQDKVKNGNLKFLTEPESEKEIEIKKLDVSMKNFTNAFQPDMQTLTNERIEKNLNEDDDENCNLIIDEESIISEAENSEEDHLLQTCRNKFQSNIALNKNNNVLTEVTDLDSKKDQKVSKVYLADALIKPLYLTKNLFKPNELHLSKPNFPDEKESSVRKIKKLKFDLNKNYDKDLKTITNKFNKIEEIKIISTDNSEMLLPFNPALQHYRPATECEGSYASHSPLNWKLVEVLIPVKDKISLQFTEKLQQSNDPRIRKQRIHLENYTFDGNSKSNVYVTSNKMNDNNTNNTNKIDNDDDRFKQSLSSNNIENTIKKHKNNCTDLSDPRKNQTNSLTYDTLKNEPSAIQILQHYLHQSVWYNQQNSKTKMVINEMVADLAENLKKFYQQKILKKTFNFSEVKNSYKIQNILKKLNIFIDSNGAILPESNQPNFNYSNSSGLKTNNFFSSINPFWYQIQTQQQHQFPIISNLVPIGSFQAPPPLDFDKPSLLGFHSNPVARFQLQNSLRTSNISHNSNLDFEKNFLHRQNNFPFPFSVPCKPIPIFEEQKQSFVKTAANHHRLNLKNQCTVNGTFFNRKNINNKNRIQKYNKSSNNKYNSNTDDIKNDSKDKFNNNNSIYSFHKKSNSTANYDMINKNHNENHIENFDEEDWDEEDLNEKNELNVKCQQLKKNNLVDKENDELETFTNNKVNNMHQEREYTFEGSSEKETELEQANLTDTKNVHSHNSNNTTENYIKNQISLLITKKRKNINISTPNSDNKVPHIKTNIKRISSNDKVEISKQIAIDNSDEENWD